LRLDVISKDGYEEVFDLFVIPPVEDIAPSEYG
jgi:hypothetical protein